MRIRTLALSLAMTLAAAAPLQAQQAPPIRVDDPLDREQQAGGALDFVDDGAVEVAHQSGRVLTGRKQQIGVIQGQVAPMRPCKLFRESGLARLPRAVQEHHGGVGKSFCQPRQQVTRIVRSH